MTITNSSDGTITLDGADYVTFENFTILATGSSGAAVYMTNAADYNTFSNCIMDANTSVTSTSLHPLVISSSISNVSGYGNNGNYNLFEDCQFKGGYYGVILVGSSNSNMAEGNSFLRNTFSQSYYYGLRWYYVSGGQFHDNVLKDFRNTYCYGFYAYYISNFDWQRNTVIGSYYGNFFGYANYYNYKKVRSTFANNKLSGRNSSYTLYAYYMSYTDLWHNSLVGTGSYLMYAYYMNNMDIRNNIFYYTGTNYAIYAYNGSVTEMDYNDFYCPNGNVAYIGTGQYQTVSALKSYSPTLNQNNFDIDPKFVNTLSDLHLTSTSPQMFGANVGVELDGDSDARCLFAPALGADEVKKLTLPPVAGFLTPDTAWLNSPVSILNSNRPSATSRTTWYVNGVMMSDSVHLVYTPTAAGTDTVKQLIENCGGKDSLTKTLVVSPALRKPKVDFSASSRAIYTNESIVLQDLSANGPTGWKWKISPAIQYDPFLQFFNRTHDYNASADSTTANPVLTFNYAGTYEVCLVVENQYGEDSVCRSQYVTVKEKFLACQIPNYSTATNGTLFDDGGADGFYSSNLTGFNACVNKISTCEGTIEFDVVDFDLNTGDYLRIYDGKGNDGKPLWDAVSYPDGMNGDMNDPSVVSQFVASTGSAYIEFVSDNNATTVGDGFEIDWNVNKQTFVAPTAGIGMPDTACVGFPVYFDNATTGIYSSVEWDVEDDGKVEGYGDEQAYTFSATGTYDVKLRSFSYCTDADSITKKIVIINAAKAPTPGVYTDRTRVNVGDTVTLYDVSQYCASSTRWGISPANYLLVNGSKLTDKDIDVVFTRNGFYDIKQVKANSFGADSVTLTNYIQALNYCEPYSISLDGDIGISNVTLNTINNTSSTGKTSYSDFTDITTTLEKGNIYALSISRATNTNKMSRKVWIDYNVDGSFDASELVLSESPSTTMTYTDSIFIPSTAGTGITRMRVATSYGSDVNTACGPHKRGEFEDYGIILSDVDKTLPIITLSGTTTDTIEVFSAWVDPGYSANDRKDGSLTGKVTISSTLDTTMVGSYTVTYNVQDAAGNSAISKSRTIYVVDRTVPTITLKGDDSVFVEIYGTYTEAGVTTADNYDASLNAVINSNLDVNSLGVYTINYCVTDANNNGPICVSRTVVVGDTIMPMITLKGDSSIIVDVYTTYMDSGYVIADNDSANVVVTSSGTWSGVPTTLGTFDLTYTATDAAGNAASTTRTIEVVDRVAPLMSLLGNKYDTVERWSAYTDAMYTISDNYYDEKDLSVEVGGTFENTQSEGVYFITYKVSDPSGNVAAEMTRMIVVVMPTSSSINEMTQIGIVTYPNPNNGQFKLEVKLPTSQMVNVSIINTMGQEVSAIYSGQAEELNQTVNVSHLPAGLYFIKVSNGEAQRIERITINN